jgi:RNA polymerase sigma factor (sigma-70 family)
MEHMNTSFYKQIGNVKNSDDLVLGNLRLVVHLAKKYQGMGLSLDDLIHEGTIGLCKARDKYDPSKGKFSTYSAQWIKAMIRQALNNKSRIIRVPAHLTHLTDDAPKVSTLDASYQGSYISQTEIKHDTDHADLKIKYLLGKLKPNQREIIKMKFGIGYNEEMKTIDIAKELGLTIQAVNGSIRNALKIMQDAQ